VPTVSADYEFGRRELAALAGSMRVRLRDRGRQIASPDELRLAVSDMLGASLSAGDVEVRRIPGGLRTPETWHLRLRSVPPEARDLLDSMLGEARGVR
jgi:hypothetical protein